MRLPLTTRARAPAAAPPRARRVAAAAAPPASSSSADNDSSITDRRALLLASSLAAALAAAPAARADDGDVVVAAAPPPPPALDAEFATLSDATLAYTFKYPTSANGVTLHLVPSRKPERYSSAAPLSPDARQRIVAELVDLAAAVTVSVTVGPPPPAGPLAESADPTAWPARAVADAVLVDRSTARTTAGQRLALASVESVESSVAADGATPRWTYEHAAQGSPSTRSTSRETFRRAWAVTTVRPGKKGTPYLYTLNLACPQDLWKALGPAFRAAADSFELVEAGRGYVAPDVDPWRFF